jgi:prophage regulatory protein
MKLIDFDGLKAKGIPLSKTQIWRLIRNKKFPAPIKIGALKNAWLETEIDALIQKRVEERDTAA